jgi:FkbM family methyltransferase
MQKLLIRCIYLIRLLFSEVYFFPLISSKYDSEKHGAKGADWWIPKNMVNPNFIFYSAGVGTDVSFDISLIKKYGLNVYAFDPTPKAIDFVQKNILSKFSKFIFIPIGLWNSNTRQKFYVPKSSTHVSHSIVNLQKTNDFFIAQCATVKTIMQLLKHKKIDMLKIDIEGAEYTVLNSMINQNIFPKILCIEFDQPASLIKIMNMTKKLLSYNYLLIKKDYFNFTFIKR